MKETLLFAIKAHDFTAIRNICFALSEEERQELKSYFARKNFNFIFREVLEKEKRYHFSNKELAIISYTIMCVCNTLEEVRKIETFQNIEPYIKGNYYYFLSSLEDEVLLDFVQSPQGAYMIEGIQLMYKDNPLEMSFQILWSVYKAGYIPLNEGIFIQRMYDLNWFKADEHLTKYLLKHPETVVLFPSVPAYIQDTIFTTEEWKKIYHTLNKKGYFTNKNAILHAFIEALLNPWKKTVLDMYCRWIETLEPSHQELLSNQHTLFALLSSDKTSVVNFVMKLIKEISSEKAFDFQAFADNFALCFTIQKIAKSQLIGLDILAKHYKQQPPVNIEYREQLAVLFTVPDAKLQEKVANLLTTYFGGKGLTEVVAPYQDYLKGKAQDLLATLSPSENSENSHSSHSSHTSQTASTALTLTPVPCPLTPEDLLFLLGDCLRERTAATIDLFFEGLVQQQESLPANYTKELAPYLKKLMKSYYLDSVTTIIKGFLYCYSHQKPLEIPPYQYTYEESNALREKLDEAAFEEYLLWNRLYKHKIFMPFLFHKAQLTLKYLNEKEVLPFLSTPTHESFYIDTEIFVDKLLQYEAVNKQPDLHDLIVACNRLIFKEVSAVAKEKSRQLKGTYAPAIQYYLGLTDEVQPTEELLPLWTQITRIKYPDREFPEFETTSAKEIPSVVKPYYIGYGWTKWRGRDMFTFHNYDVGYDEKSEKGYWIGHYRNSFSPLYYNACGGSTPLSTEVNYLLSLNPHYPDAILCGYIANNACGADEIRNMQLPLEAVLRYDLRVRHSGWLYIGACLLYDKRPSRDLAYEYILQALARGEDLHYVARYLSDVLAMHFSPINRFVEFLDRPTRDPKLKAFQRKVVALYLEETKKQDKLPRNHKKLAEFSH